MRCEEVQERLSEYLERLLDPGQSKSIDSHLASCPRCTAELAELSECRRLVAALPMVEPPVGFSTRVMAHVREGAEHPAWWQRLFLPLRAKLPLQATALLLISVLSVYLLKKENPQEKLLSPTAPQVETEALKQSGEAVQGFVAPDLSARNPAPRADSATTAKARVQPDLLEALPDDRTKKGAATEPKPSLTVKSSAIQPALKAGTETAPAAPHSIAEERANRVESTAADAELPPTPSRPISGTIGVSQPAGGRAAPASPSMDAILQERAMRAPLPERARPAPTGADIEIVVRRHSQPASDLRDGAEPLRKETERRLGSPNISGLTAPRAAAAASEPLLRTIPADQYEQFKKDLAIQGTIISEVRTGGRENDGQPPANQTLTIKVTFVPAETAR